jgi:16S rRNA (adenine1518-N6/adenine1519-N6)-dimethyltransferase
MDIQKKYAIKAKKSLWQNFLKDETILSQIVWVNTIVWSEIIEVWPWYGALSEKIVRQKPQRFEMIELDPFLVNVLHSRIREEKWEQYCPKIQLTEMDVLQYQREDISSYSVIANIPYYITSPILDHFLYRVRNIPDSMTILMQKEVADKIMKQYHHKKPKSSVLSLFIAKKMDVVKVCDAWAFCFDPPPKVDSSVLHFTRKEDIFNDKIDDEIFLNFIKKAFCEPRKKLISNLSKNGYDTEILKQVFDKYGIILTVRAEDLHLHDYLDVLESLG